MFCGSSVSDRGMCTQIKDTMCKLLSPNNKTAIQWNGNAKINVPKKELILKQIYQSLRLYYYEKLDIIFTNTE